MVNILKFCGYLLFFILALMFFMPKVSSYYYAEQELQKHKVILSNEELIDNGFSLQVNHINLSYDSIDSARVESLNVKLFLMYNIIKVEKIRLDSIVSSFFPVEVDTIIISHHIFNPLKVFASAEGEFGSAVVEVSVLDRNLSATIKPSEIMLQKYKKTLSMMKKQENGEYTYDKAF